jgi:hypothetical protein
VVWARDNYFAVIFLVFLGTLVLTSMTHSNRTKSHIVEEFGSRLMYDRKSAARQISVSIRSYDYLVATKKIATRRCGRKVMTTHAELVRFCKSNHYANMADDVAKDTAVAESEQTNEAV